MIKKLLCIALSCVLMITVNSTLVSAQTKTGNAAEIKTNISKRGTGEKKRVTVKMSNGKKMKGYINQIGEDSFDLKDSKTGQSTTVAYEDVSKISNGSGNNLGLIIGLSAAAAAAAIVVAIIVGTYCNNEGGC